MKKLASLLLVLATASLFPTALLGAELQGVIADWNCTKQMVRVGREKVLKQNHSCSLEGNVHRSAYGLITDDKKFYKIDPKDNQRVIQMLSDTHSKDSLRVVISGDLHGNTISVNTISEL